MLKSVQAESSKAQHMAPFDAGACTWQSMLLGGVLHSQDYRVWSATSATIPGHNCGIECGKYESLLKDTHEHVIPH